MFHIIWGVWHVLYFIRWILPLQESIDRQANCIFSILNEQFFTDK
jgi:hypothetical protein